MTGRGIFKKSPVNHPKTFLGVNGNHFGLLGRGRLWEDENNTPMNLPSYVHLT